MTTKPTLISKSRARASAMEWRRLEQLGPYRQWPDGWYEPRTAGISKCCRIVEIGYPALGHVFVPVVRLAVDAHGQCRVLKDRRNQSTQWPVGKAKDLAA